MARNRNLAIFLFTIIPTGLLSRLFGHIARIPLPGIVLNPVIRWYSKKFGVNTGEILLPEGSFRTLDAFFTRQLRDGARPVDNDPRSIVSPVDARVDMFGDIGDATILQAKGVDYSLKDLIPSDFHRHFIDGSFLTLYLSPGDYHRIHSPVSGDIAGYFAVPGRLLTVQDYMVRGYRGLFAKNERLISYIRTSRGMVAVCKIGAMNVGRITLSYSNVVTNCTFRKKEERLYPEGSMPRIEKGGELGIFHLGSTVILLFPKNAARFEKLMPGTKVVMGQKIAAFIP